MHWFRHLSVMLGTAKLLPDILLLPCLQPVIIEILIYALRACFEKRQDDQGRFGTRPSNPQRLGTVRQCYVDLSFEWSNIGFFSSLIKPEMKNPCWYRPAFLMLNLALLQDLDFRRFLWRLPSNGVTFISYTSPGKGFVRHRTAFLTHLIKGIEGVQVKLNPNALRCSSSPLSKTRLLADPSPPVADTGYYEGTTVTMTIEWQVKSITELWGCFWKGFSRWKHCCIPWSSVIWNTEGNSLGRISPLFRDNKASIPRVYW